MRTLRRRLLLRVLLLAILALAVLVTPASAADRWSGIGKPLPYQTWTHLNYHPCYLEHGMRINGKLIGYTLYVRCGPTWLHPIPD